ncbi:PREDICTED: uncharacterized protein LOC104602797 isoform X1 [Nelumbo nucifera]|uniref:Uncharacterized protein LOC104602797 isoform X1 n=1 Tax=Nelumbo nucifera TaxID=4432 RepID=A0A1U8ABV0_NELNU|nr:PREDICTED: uncharacterized protein LOC104602797 isoform X1 [Nelumbo nucifera]
MTLLYTKQRCPLHLFVKFSSCQVACISKVESTVNDYTPSEDMELIRQMNDLGLSVSFSTNKELFDFGLVVTVGAQNKNNIKLSGTLGYVALEYLLDDVKDIKCVINYDFLSSLEDYVHRIGANLLMQMQSLPEILLRSYKMVDKLLVQHWLQWPGQVVHMVEVQVHGGTSTQGDGEVVVLEIEL